MRNWVRPAIVAGFSGFILGGAVVTAGIGLVSEPAALRFAGSAGAWLRVIPDAFYQLIGALGVGYFAARSADKFTDKRAETKQAEARAVRDYAGRVDNPEADQ